MAKSEKSDPPFSVFTVDDKIERIFLNAVCNHYEPLGWDVHAGKGELLFKYMRTCYWFYWFSERK